MQVRVEQADITSLSVDAVVNPANSMGIMGAGVSERLRRLGGEQIQAQAMERAPIAVGAALVTNGGNLPAKHVIHAPTVSEPGLKISVENIRRAARAALIAADANEFQEVAFPRMGTEIDGVEIAESARAIVEEVRAHKRNFPKTVLLVDESSEMLEAFEDALRKAQQGL